MSVGYFSVDFISPLDDEYKCIACNFCVREPLKMVCKHRICTQCFATVNRESAGRPIFCPIDGQASPPTFVVPDEYAEREVLSLQTMCKFRESGCPWKGELQNYEEHITKCYFGMVDCSNIGCGLKIQRGHFQTHIAEQCSFRILLCGSCGCKVSMFSLNNHLKICEKYLLQLAQEQKKSITMLLERHTKWESIKLLGIGAFGKVSLACFSDLINNDMGFAVKQVDTIGRKTSLNKQLKEIVAEITFLQNLHHERIVQYYGMEKTASSMYIFMEYMPGGTLQEYVYNSKGGHLGERQIRTYCRQILEGVSYLHLNLVVHRDIKGANILLTSDYRSVKLGDFGVSKTLEQCCTFSGLKSSRGTPFWMAPEVVLASKDEGKGYGRKADIWSVGCVVIEMLTGDHPWCDLEPMQAVFQIGMGKKPPLPENISDSSKDFLLQTFKQYQNRPSAKDLLDHPFITT